MMKLSNILHKLFNVILMIKYFILIVLDLISILVIILKHLRMLNIVLSLMELGQEDIKERGLLCFILIGLIKLLKLIRKD